MKEYKIKIPFTEHIGFSYSANVDNLSEKEMKEMNLLQDRLCKLLDVDEVRAENLSIFISVKKEENCVWVTVKAPDVEITEVGE